MGAPRRTGAGLPRAGADRLSRRRHKDEWAQHTLSVPLVVGHCRNCRAGRRHLCAHSVSIGATAPGAFAEYLTLPAVNVWPADERIPLDTLAMFDPLGNAVHTALSFDLVGEDVLITGAGPVGCLAAAVVRHAGARHVVITDRFRVTDAGRVVLELEIDPVKKLMGRLVNTVQKI